MASVFDLAEVEDVFVDIAKDDYQIKSKMVDRFDRRTSYLSHATRTKYNTVVVTEISSTCIEVELHTEKRKTVGGRPYNAHVETLVFNITFDLTKNRASIFCKNATLPNIDNIFWCGLVRHIYVYIL